uniref:Glutamate receptor n=1 Tax=Panagrellus redivivus TaxID=6233 RepID=A0A7E4ZQF5_PANRE
MSRVNLAGQKLRVVVYLEEPFVMKVDDGIGYDGFCIDLLIEMSKLLNFTFEIIEVEDGAYGVEDETGQWNGIIGVLQRHEADLSVSAVTITYSRVSVIDFTLPFMHLGIAILMGRNNEEALSVKSASETLFTFMEPYSFNVWTLLALSYVSVGMIMWLLARFSPYEWFEELGDHNGDNHQNQFNLLDALWFAIGSLMQQGSDVIPRAAATRTVAVFWWMFTLICISSYTAKLAAFLTVERMNTPIESAADLAAQQKIKFGTLKNGSTMDFFKEAKIPIYERMWSMMQGQTPTVFVNSSKEAITRVKAGNYAYMMESSMLEFYMKTDCELQTIGGLLDSKGYGVAVPKGSPLRDILSKTVLRLQERTILEALKNKWWNGDQENRNCPSVKTKESSAHQVFGIFYVLFTGIIIAMLIAFGEFCIESKNRSIRLDMTIPGKLFNWWHMRKFKQKAESNGDRNNSTIAITRLDNLNESGGIPGRHPPVLTRTSAGQGHSYLLDEQREKPISGLEAIAARVAERRRNEFKQLSRLIPPRDEALINRRYSVMSSSTNRST